MTNQKWIIRFIYSEAYPQRVGLEPDTWVIFPAGMIPQPYESVPAQYRWTVLINDPYMWRKMLVEYNKALPNKETLWAAF